MRWMHIVSNIENIFLYNYNDSGLSHSFDNNAYTWCGLAQLVNTISLGDFHSNLIGTFMFSNSLIVNKKHRMLGLNFSICTVISN